MIIIAAKVKTGLYISEHEKVVVVILQGSVVTQTVLGGLTIYRSVANFLQYTYTKIMTVGWQPKLLQQ